MARIKTKSGNDDRKLREDISSFKSSCAFIIFCLIMFLTVSNIRNNQENYNFRIYLDNNGWLFFIPLGIFAISIVLRLIAAKKKVDESCRYFSTHDLLGLASLFVVYSLTYAATTSVLMYNMVVIGFAVGYYTKRFFGMDFYVVTIANISIAFALRMKYNVRDWLSPLATTATSILIIGALITVVAVIVFAVGRMISGKTKTAATDKVLCAFGVKVSKDSSDLSLFPVFISIIIGAVLAGILQFSPASMTLLVAEIIILVQYIALGVFYTVKLINE